LRARESERPALPGDAFAPLTLNENSFVTENWDTHQTLV
jgi:hypothetical protein